MQIKITASETKTFDARPSLQGWLTRILLLQNNNRKSGSCMASVSMRMERMKEPQRSRQTRDGIP